MCQYWEAKHDNHTNKHKMKTFKEQLLKVIKAEYHTVPRTEEEYQSELEAYSTQAAETLITGIRQWPSQYTSRNVTTARLLEGWKWDDTGRMWLDADHKGRQYPCRISLELGYDAYRYGDQTKQVCPSYSFPGALKNIPDNVQEDWQDEIKHLFSDINRMPVDAFKLINLGKNVKVYGINNPNTYANWDRQVNEFKAAQEAINKFVHNRHGWEWLSTDNMQDPKHHHALSEMLTEILIQTDSRIAPAYAALKKSHEEMEHKVEALLAAQQ